MKKYSKKKTISSADRKRKAKSLGYDMRGGRRRVGTGQIVKRINNTMDRYLRSLR